MNGDALYERRLLEQQQTVQPDPVQQIKSIQAQIPKAPQRGGYTVCMDFDGVLSFHRTGDSIDKIGPPLLPGIQLAKRIVASGHKLVILTARPEQMHNTILGWLKGNGVKAYEVTSTKPPAALYIDDRGREWPQNFDGKNRTKEGGPGSGPHPGSGGKEKSGKGSVQQQEVFTVKTHDGQERPVYAVRRGQNINTSAFSSDVMKDNGGLVRVMYSIEDDTLVVPDAGMQDLDHGDYLIDVSGNKNPDLATVRGAIDLNDGSVEWYDLTSEAEAVASMDKPGNFMYEKQVAKKLSENLERASNFQFYVDGKKSTSSTTPIGEVLGFESSRESRKFTVKSKLLRKTKKSIIGEFGK